MAILSKQLVTRNQLNNIFVSLVYVNVSTKTEVMQLPVALQNTVDADENANAIMMGILSVKTLFS